MSIAVDGLSPVPGGLHRPPDGLKKSIRVLLTTWNVGNEEAGDLRPLITSKHAEGIDMVVLGLQEAKYRVTSPQRGGVHVSDNMMERVKLVLGETFTPVRTRALGEMQLGVFVRASLHPFVKDIHASVERCGVADVGSNKGGIAIRLTIGKVSFAFVSAHLAAHEGAQYREERHKDVAEILGGTLHFGSSHVDPANMVDHLFFMGDLNYRMVHSFPAARAAAAPAATGGGVAAGAGAGGAAAAAEIIDTDAPAPPEEPSFEVQWAYVKQLVDAQNWEQLRKHDELTHERQDNVIFAGFQECQPAFPPTFKVDRKPGFFYKNQRIPAWCDRVLWKSLPHCIDDVRALSYEPVGEVGSSDHKPVQALFQIELPEPRCFHEAPLPKGLAPNSGCLIIFQELAAYDMPRMDVGSENDCYVQFLSRHIFHTSSKLCTKTKNNEAHPRWTEAEIPTLVTRFANLEALSDQSLALVVLDSDMMRDDVIGFAHLHLGLVLEHQKRNITPPFVSYQFTLPLHFKGQLRGHVTGRVELHCQVAST